MRLREASAVLLCLALFACGTSAGQRKTEAQTVTVFAASSLAEAFSKLGSIFEGQHPGSKVRFNFSASDTLATQINQGAPADVFAAASEAAISTLSASLFERPSRTFASNKLLIIVPKDNPANLNAPRDVAARGVKLVLAAPGVPAGAYARELLDNLGIRKQAEQNVVSNEVDDKSVVSKVLFGDADAGIVYVSDLTSDVGPKLTAISIPERDNVVAHYPIVALKDGPAPAAARRFVDLILSPTGQNILRDFGFGPP